MQPPFYDPTAVDALNYGGIGAVIGHEITHGFDDEGSKYDAQGNLKSWWTEADRKTFDERTSCVVNQFSQYKIGGDVSMNGKLTLGENTADLGGLTMAYLAFEKSMEGKPKPEKIGGFTPEQLFFLGWAQAWAEVSTPQGEAYRRKTIRTPSPVSASTDRSRICRNFRKPSAANKTHRWSDPIFVRFGRAWIFRR